MTKIKNNVWICFLLKKMNDPRNNAYYERIRVTQRFDWLPVCV